MTSEDSSPGAIIPRLTTFDDLHRALFPEGPPPAVTVEEMDDAIEHQLAAEQARR
jgi:hypothetical protein